MKFGLSAFTVALTASALVIPATAAQAVQCEPGAPIFATRPDGTVWEYSHHAPDQGGNDWSEPQLIATGWDGRVLAGPDGRLYRITSDGEVFQHERGGDGRLIASGWTGWDDPAFRNRITVDSQGDFFTVQNDGVLRWLHHDGTSWSVRVLATGWDRYDLIVAAGDGVIYARDPEIADGVLLRHQYHEGSQRWLQQDRSLGGGWNGHRALFSAGADVLYGRENNDRGDLVWYRWNNAAGGWHEGTPSWVGSGWGHDWEVTATSNACRLADASLPQRVPVAVNATAPVELAEANGVLQVYWVDAAGKLQHATGADRVPAQIGEAGFATTPSAAHPAVFALKQDGDTVRTDQGFTSVGGWTPGPVKALRDVNGELQLFAVDASGRLWERHEKAGELLPWRSLAVRNLAGEVTAVSTGAGIEVLARATEGNLTSTLYVAHAITRTHVVPGGTITGNPAAAADGRLYARGTDGKLYTASDGGAWTVIDGVTPSGSPAAAGDKVAVRGTDGFVHVHDRNGWRQLGRSDTDPSMIRLGDGKVVTVYRDPALQVVE